MFSMIMGTISGMSLGVHASKMAAWAKQKIRPIEKQTETIIGQKLPSATAGFGGTATSQTVVKNLNASTKYIMKESRALSKRGIQGAILAGGLMGLGALAHWRETRKDGKIMGIFYENDCASLQEFGDRYRKELAQAIHRGEVHRSRASKMHWERFEKCFNRHP